MSIPRSVLGYGRTWKDTLLECVLRGVTSWTVPAVAPEGTVVVIFGTRPDSERRRRAVKADARTLLERGSLFTMAPDRQIG